MRHNGVAGQPFPRFYGQLADASEGHSCSAWREAFGR
jgi:hypothetical protein